MRGQCCGGEKGSIHRRHCILRCERRLQLFVIRGSTSGGNGDWPVAPARRRRGPGGSGSRRTRRPNIPSPRSAAHRRIHAPVVASSAAGLLPQLPVLPPAADRPWRRHPSPFLPEIPRPPPKKKRDAGVEELDSGAEEGSARAAPRAPRCRLTASPKLPPCHSCCSPEPVPLRCHCSPYPAPSPPLLLHAASPTLQRRRRAWRRVAGVGATRLHGHGVETSHSLRHPVAASTGSSVPCQSSRSLCASREKGSVIHSQSMVALSFYLSSRISPGRNCLFTLHNMLGAIPSTGAISREISCHSVMRMSADLRDLFLYEDFLYYNPLLLVALIIWLWGMGSKFMGLRTIISQLC